MPKSSIKAIERQLRTLQARLEKAKSRSKQPALRRIAALADEHGITLQELKPLLSKRGPGRPKGKSSHLKGLPVKAMYRNPKTGETWSGRGRAARWLAALERAGRKRSEFLIKH